MDTTTVLDALQQVGIAVALVAVYVLLVHVAHKTFIYLSDLFL